MLKRTIEEAVEMQRDTMIKYAWSFLGTPYSWGGESPMGGYDCSGFVQEVLKSVGFDPVGDQTAQRLYSHFKKDKVAYSNAGCIAFYGRNTENISHVAILVNKFQVIEAGGGGRKTISKANAKRDKAFIRIRPIDSRSDRICISNPFAFLTKG